MPITYYPDSKHKKAFYPIEKLQKRAELQTKTINVDLSTAGMNYRLWNPYDWGLYEGLLKFSDDTTSRNYSINKLIGVGIVKDLNDFLWFFVDGQPKQKIVLSQGFYTGSELCDELKLRLDTNQAFIDAGSTPFSVTYSDNKFEITPSGGELGYLAINTGAPLQRHSSAGVVVGFTEDKHDSSIESDRDVPMLGEKVVISSAAGVTDQDIVIHELAPCWVFDIDQALSIDVDTANISIYGHFVFKELVD
jgi:hypothetical protein